MNLELENLQELRELHELLTDGLAWRIEQREMSANETLTAENLIGQVEDLLKKAEPCECGCGNI